eukprot:2716080-Pleurochrysis_carterae.AAC.1
MDSSELPPRFHSLESSELPSESRFAGRADARDGRFLPSLACATTCDARATRLPIMRAAGGAFAARACANAAVPK